MTTDAFQPMTPSATRQNTNPLSNDMMPHAIMEVGTPKDGPILVFGGPYSNQEATKAILNEARRQGIPTERILCTGDVVAYGPDPVETVARLRDARVTVIMGNCEEAFGWQRPDCGCGFTTASTCDRLSSAWYAYADARLTAADRAWMRALPRRLDLRLPENRRLAVVHGSPQRLNHFVFASDPWVDKAAHIHATGCVGIIAGHSGLPFTQSHDGLLWHNAGAIGMPANDGTPRVWYSLLTPHPAGLDIHTHALTYDHATTARKMRAAGLPPGYADALETGRWPSLDSLPPTEASAIGRPLVAEHRRWRFL
jgi:predicted phosphodiesterase